MESYRPLRSEYIAVESSQSVSSSRPTSPSSPDTLERGLTTEDDAVVRDTRLARPRWMLPRMRFQRLWSIAPWWLSACLGKTSRQLPRTTSTSYLNGLRAIACLVVYQYHLTATYYEDMMYPYGADHADSDSFFMQLPVLRIIYSGRAMVCLFFVLSGFVLSYSPLRKMQQGRLSTASLPPSPALLSSFPSSPSSPSFSQAASVELMTGLCSSVLRRGIRLFGPALALVYITAAVAWFRPDYDPGGWRDGDPSIFEHLWRFFYDIFLPLLNPFTWADNQAADGMAHCWTLPVEYRGSMIIFLMCLTTSRLTTRARKLFVSLTAVAGFCWGRWEVFCFLSGMLFAEMRHAPLSLDLPSFLVKYQLPQIVRSFLFVLLFALSLLFMSWPSYGAQKIEPWSTMEHLKPPFWRKQPTTDCYFFGSVGSVGLVLALENLPLLQRPLTTAPMKYLGEISFSFYLLHWVTYVEFGSFLKTFLMKSLEMSEDDSYYVMNAITVIVVINSADIFWRAVDEKCVQLSRAFVSWMGVHQDHDATPVVLGQPSIDANEPPKLE